jgi:hypothetical protein
MGQRGSGRESISQLGHSGQTVPGPKSSVVRGISAYNGAPMCVTKIWIASMAATLAVVAATTLASAEPVATVIKQCQQAGNCTYSRSALCSGDTTSCTKFCTYDQNGGKKCKQCDDQGNDCSLPSMKAPRQTWRNRPTTVTRVANPSLGKTTTPKTGLTTTAPSALSNPNLLGGSGAGSAATTSSKTKLPATAH